MNYLRNWMWLMVLGCALPLGAGAQASPAQLEVVPQTLELNSCNDGAHLLVIARNPSSTETASDLEIKTFADVPVEVSPKSVSAKKLKPGEDISWDLTVTCTSTFTTGGLQVVLTSKVERAGGALGHIVTKPVTVRVRDPLSLDNIAAVDVKSTLESLTSSEQGDLSVVITNKTVQPIQVKITPTGPTFIKFSSSQAQPLTIGPLDYQMVPFTVTTAGKLKPGKQLLIFHVELQTDRGKRDFLLTKEINVGVMGESTALKLLGVPSLLFLPGFLFMSSYLLLWRWKWLRHDADASAPVDEASSGFWLLAITISIIISGFFWLIRHDFFSYYDLDDVLTVWVTSIGLGVVAYLLWHLYLNWREGQKYPKRGDAPVVALRKLLPFIDDISVPRGNIKGGKTPAFVFVPNEEGPIYVSPLAVLTWDTDADANLRERVQRQLTTGGKLKTVLEIVEPELKKRAERQPSSVVSFKWDKSDPANQGAHKVPKEDVLEQQPAAVIVSESN